jgi:hypothetical protein
MVTSLRSKWGRRQGGPRRTGTKGAYLSRYVTDEQHPVMVGVIAGRYSSSRHAASMRNGLAKSSRSFLTALTMR